MRPRACLESGLGSESTSTTANAAAASAGSDGGAVPVLAAILGFGIGVGLAFSGGAGTAAADEPRSTVAPGDSVIQLPNRRGGDVGLSSIGVASVAPALADLAGRDRASGGIDLGDEVARGARSASYATMSSSSRFGAREARTGPRLRMLDRSISPAPGGWSLDYRFRVESESELVVTPAEVRARIEGWVSNGRVPGLEVPRRSVLEPRGDAGLTASHEVLPAEVEAGRSIERVRMFVWRERPELGRDSAARRLFADAAPAPTFPKDRDHDGSEPNPATAPIPVAASVVAAAPAPDSSRDPVSLETVLALFPGDTLRARFELSHDRFLHGRHEPLLGDRDIRLRVGDAEYADRVELTLDRPRPAPACRLPDPPADRMDSRYYVTAPHSLHLEADVPGNQSYRFPDQEVRYATPMKLSFWYMVALGTEGRSKARVSQYREGPATTWKVLSDGCFEIPFETVGEWTRVERVFRTEAEATTLALDFRIVGADIGEVWIDDVRLEPIEAAPVRP